MKKQGYKLFKSTNLQSAKYIFLILVFFAGSFALARPNKLGRFMTTFYYVINEKSFFLADEVPVKDVQGGTIAMVSVEFKKAMDIEGTGILRDGRTVNYAQRIEGEIRYRVSSAKWGWGVGQCKLIPYKTIAVDPKVIPLGTRVFIPEAKGALLPDGTKHDGIFYAEDMGSAIKDYHVDLFSKEGMESSAPYESVGIHSSGYVDILKISDPDPKGCHTKDPLNLRSVKFPFLGKMLEKLKIEADEYARLRKPTELRRALRMINDLRANLELEPQADLSSLIMQVSAPDINEVNGSTLGDHEVVLTFDDGPHNTFTPAILDLLEKQNQKATFFEVGEMVKAHPQNTRLVAGHGQMLGNHSYSHPQLTKIPIADVKKQIQMTQRIIVESLGGSSEFNKYYEFFFHRPLFAPEFMRSPYGSRNDQTMQVISDLGFLHVMWNVDSLDWKDPSPQGIEDRVFNQLETVGRHGVILFHDIHPQTVGAIGLILPRLQREGYRIVSLLELAKTPIPRIR